MGATIHILDRNSSRLAGFYPQISVSFPIRVWLSGIEKTTPKNPLNWPVTGTGFLRKYGWI
ncbi:MAG: hypothetical protein CVV34_05220 [Methanomicrobiales archaeon HGW-Methanomicrobiales-5]|nr:MAG: hypothetical protein CVV34_05220 [Methanomicrobiales archaeon HGW-Methanomicrobiales-5]